MKKLLLVLGLVLSVDAFADDETLFGVDWLEKGLTGVVEKKAGDRNTASMPVLCYYYSFIQTVNVTFALEDEDAKKTNPLCFPDDGMRDLFKTAPSILAFIRDRRTEMGPKTGAAEVLMAWYLTHHSKASGSSVYPDMLLKGP